VLDEAVTYFEAALRAHPNDPEVQLKLARAHRIRARR
jgi:hypothetical protein